MHTTCCVEYGIWTCSAKSHEMWSLASMDFTDLMAFESRFEFSNDSFAFFIQSLKINNLVKINSGIYNKEKIYCWYIYL